MHTSWYLEVLKDRNMSQHQFIVRRVWDYSFLEAIYLAVALSGLFVSVRGTL